MKYIKVKDNQVCSGIYPHSDIDLNNGESVLPVVEFTPYYDESYQYLTNPVFTITGESVEIHYSVENNVELYKGFVEQRLTAFASERDIDVQEIGMLLNCSNSQWVQEAQHFMQLYTQTWESFYSATSTDWLEIEASLPQLTWT